MLAFAPRHPHRIIRIVPLATHIIWTTYGTWLPGDDRGHWSPLFDLYGHLRSQGHQLNISDETSLRRAKALMKEPAKLLDLEEMQLASDVIGNVLGGTPIGRFVPQKPGPIATARALAIEPNHVHLLIGPLSDDLDATIGRIKGVSSSLIRALPKNSGRARTWTAHFWRVFLYDEVALHSVYTYVIDHNLRAGKSAHPFSFTRAI